MPYVQVVDKSRWSEGGEFVLVVGIGITGP